MVGYNYIEFISYIWSIGTTPEFRGKIGFTTIPNLNDYADYYMHDEGVWEPILPPHTWDFYDSHSRLVQGRSLTRYMVLFI